MAPQPRNRFSFGRGGGGEVLAGFTAGREMIQLLFAFFTQFSNIFSFEGSLGVLFSTRV